MEPHVRKLQYREASWPWGRNEHSFILSTCTTWQILPPVVLGRRMVRTHEGLQIVYLGTLELAPYLPRCLGSQAVGLTRKTLIIVVVQSPNANLCTHSLTHSAALDRQEQGSTGELPFLAPLPGSHDAYSPPGASRRSAEYPGLGSPWPDPVVLGRSASTVHRCKEPGVLHLPAAPWLRTP